MNFYEIVNTIHELAVELQSLDYSCDLNNYIDEIIESALYLRDETYICNNCERILSYERAFVSEYDNETYCCCCYEENKLSSPIKAYHEGKDLKFKNLDERYPLYYRGLEVEIETNISDKVLEVLRNADSSLFRFEEDGSLENGFEIITAPMSRFYWDKVGYLKLSKLINNLKNVSNIRAWNTGRCGLHIHFNKIEISRETQNVLKKFMVENHDFIAKISGRDEFRYCRKPTYDDYDYNSNGDIYNYNRYLTLNFTSNTLEFRFWRGTLKTENIKASVQLTEDLIRFAEFASEHDIEPTENRFITYITANNPELNNFKNERHKRWERHYGVQK